MSEVERVLTWPTGEVVDVESVEAYADDARASAHPLDDGVIRTPDWVIDALADVSKWADRMVKVIEMAEALKRSAKLALDEKRAQAVLDVAGFPVREHAARVMLATVEERRAYDRAAVAFEKARRVGNLLKDHSIRVESIAKQVELTYRFGGDR